MADGAADRSRCCCSSRCSSPPTCSRCSRAAGCRCCIAACIGLIMVTWVRGSRLLVKQTRKNEADLDWLLRKLEAKPPHRVPGTAVFFTGDPDAAPTALMHNLKHNRVLHERNIILSITHRGTAARAAPRARQPSIA